MHQVRRLARGVLGLGSQPPQLPLYFIKLPLLGIGVSPLLGLNALSLAFKLLDLVELIEVDHFIGYQRFSRLSTAQPEAKLKTTVARRYPLELLHHVSILRSLELLISSFKAAAQQIEVATVQKLKH